MTKNLLMLNQGLWWYGELIFLLTLIYKVIFLTILSTIIMFPSEPYRSGLQWKTFPLNRWSTIERENNQKLWWAKMNKRNTKTWRCSHSLWRIHMLKNRNVNQNKQKLKKKDLVLPMVQNAMCFFRCKLLRGMLEAPKSSLVEESNDLDLNTAEALVHVQAFKTVHTVGERWIAQFIPQVTCNSA